MGAGIGAAAGATAGMIGVLMSRGPDAVLAKGSTLEMVMDRPISFTEKELDFGELTEPPRGSIAATPGPNSERKSPLPLPRAPLILKWRRLPACPVASRPERN